MAKKNRPSVVFRVFFFSFDRSWRKEGLIRHEQEYFFASFNVAQFFFLVPLKTVLIKALAKEMNRIKFYGVERSANH